MRNQLLCLTAALAVAGCSSESNHPFADVDGATVLHSSATAFASARSTTGASSGVASLPDRGTLLAFNALQAPLRSGASTLYPVQLSEAHALHAAAAGRSIDITTPDGTPLRFAYSNHSEDAFGNWTWVGTTREGLNAVITYGEDAVFGQIAMPGTAPLQLTTRHGRTWMSVTDPSRFMSANTLRQGRPDYLVPNPNAAAGYVAVGGKSAAQPSSALTVSTKASPGNTVDILLGYTAGMVSSYGSVSVVNTRLSNMVAVTNAAYQSSLITPRVRLVHTLQVSYTDTSSNETALNELSGVVCNPTCSSAPVPAALQPLRTARDQYGADLVSLVRPLRAPQHDGCGIAWILGGNLDTIDNSYASFGYSVVSDGQDLNEVDGNTYGCYIETLAHELGHNMGQAHNTQDADAPGTHSYSYGYREASTTGFFTIMAYSIVNSSQFPISYFANPSVNDAGTGRVTGTASANNALSLNQTMPLVAQFRASVVPFDGGAHNDINGNGTSDLVWANNGAAQWAYWLMNNASSTGTAAYNIPGLTAVATADLDADGLADVILRDANNKHFYRRSRGDGTFDSGTITGVAANWSIVATGDVNGDGRDDIVWHSPSTQQYAIWFMGGVNVISSAKVYGVPGSYALIGVGDIDGDGLGDLVWDNPSIRQLYAWRNAGTAGPWTYLALGGYSTGWQPVDLGDLNGDGRSADLVWQNPSAGLVAHWFMNSASKLGTGAVNVGVGTAVPAVGDLNGDGLDDLILRNGSLVSLRRIQANGTYDAAVTIGNVGPAWQLLR